MCVCVCWVNARRTLRVEVQVTDRQPAGGLPSALSVAQHSSFNYHRRKEHVVTCSDADESNLRIQSSPTRQFATKPDRQLHLTVRQGCTEFRAETIASYLLMSLHYSTYSRQLEGESGGCVELLQCLGYQTECRCDGISLLLVYIVQRQRQRNTEHWWNDADREKQIYWEKYLSQCHFVHHKSHTDWPGVTRTRALRMWRRDGMLTET